MKRQRRALTATIVGLTGLFMMGTQSLAAGDHGTTGYNNKDRLAHMSQGGSANMPMRGGMQGQMSPRGGMGPGMMIHGDGQRQDMMDRGMMGRGMMRPDGGRDHGFDKPITPMIHLSVEDVQHALQHRLERRGNKRLKVGSVKVEGDDTIIAEIVTVDDSLVRRLEVDRHTGRVQPAE